jgi:hypothetical protein
MGSTVLSTFLPALTKKMDFRNEYLDSAAEVWRAGIRGKTGDGDAWGGAVKRMDEGGGQLKIESKTVEGGAHGKGHVTSQLDEKYR